MQKDESRTELGTVRIYKNVIASIAAISALEIEGVKRIGGDLKSAILDSLGRKTVSAIKVDFDKANYVKLEIPLIIKYGFNIPDIASRVQENIRNALEKMTSLSIKDININVQGIERG